MIEERHNLFKFVIVVISYLHHVFGSTEQGIELPRKGFIITKHIII